MQNAARGSPFAWNARPGFWGRRCIVIKQNLKKESQQQTNTYGMYVTMADVSVIEMAAYAGFDFVRIDCEHYLIDPSTLLHMIAAANACGLSVHVRVPCISEITRVLEAGADGIVVPHVSTKAAAIEAVNAVKFAPLGERGMYNGYRCMQYGRIVASDYLSVANDLVTLTVQIEDVEGLANIDEILSVPGIDMVSSGKADLSQSMGYLGQSSHPEVLKAEESIATAALAHGVYPSFLVSATERIRALQAIGVHSFTVARDRKLLMDGMLQTVSRFA